jgi:protein arginine kinase activator
VHLTDIVNKKKREAHLCEKCARERNLLPDQPGPQIDLKALLSLMMSQPPAQSGPARAAPEATACPMCGMSYAAFKAAGRFGCAHDYEAFRPTLESLFEKVHRATEHRGKMPAAARRAARAAGLADLRDRMNAAAGSEDYEEAARLRDLIRQMEAEGTPG